MTREWSDTAVLLTIIGLMALCYVVVGVLG